jgi:hypothetical protein
VPVPAIGVCLKAYTEGARDQIVTDRIGGADDAYACKRGGDYGWWMPACWRGAFRKLKVHTDGLRMSWGVTPWESSEQ